MGHFNPIQTPQLQEIKDLQSLLEKLYAEEGQFTLKDLAVNGNILIKELKITA
ncbi:MAG: hypothetical protein GXP45_07285 [bacterium]|nr:hypothetical protein [bacterium]